MAKGGSTMGGNVAVAKDFASRMLDCNKESGTMWCGKGTIFSYTTPIATFVEDPYRQLHVVLTTLTYTPTTTKHQAIVREEVRKMSHRVIEINAELKHPMLWDEVQYLVEMDKEAHTE